MLVCNYRYVVLDLCCPYLIICSRLTSDVSFSTALFVPNHRFTDSESYQQACGIKGQR